MEISETTEDNKIVSDANIDEVIIIKQKIIHKVNFKNSIIRSIIFTIMKFSKQIMFKVFKYFSYAKNVGILRHSSLIYFSGLYSYEAFLLYKNS